MYIHVHVYDNPCTMFICNLNDKVCTCTCTCTTCITESVQK